MTELLIKTSQPLQQIEMQRQGLNNKAPADGISGEKFIDSKNNQGSAKEEIKGEQLQQLQDNVSKLNDYMQNINRNLQFTVDKKSGSSVIIVRDSETDEIIRQFPSEEILNARSAIEQAETKGIFVEAKI